MRFEVDALLVDMDGTLIDSTASVLRGWKVLAEEFAIPADRFAAVPRHGRPAVEILRELVDPERVDRAAARLDELEISDVDGIVPLPGAVALLSAAPAGTLAVVTSAGRGLATARLRAAGLTAPVLVTADDVARGKPDPEPFLLGAELLGAKPARCLVLEDAPAGLAAGRAAGAACIAVAATHHAGDLDADVVVPDLSALRIERTDTGLVVEVADVG
ncbi:MAG TPA: HAD-IA family hydrolase [Actinocrinis sp.]|jgi:sugar-phosphatase|uniref:HAD-IA family hydrolase n=1 Tax=Actinocrinis sp. TaxID=1920516 RepID=UPI002DDCD05C|nr:HAD-IA family hydrolase [Actinocrinis sp.]HEV3170844.1 HAD-IA family hydrolase [Actinocrinis sp.]